MSLLDNWRPDTLFKFKLVSWLTALCLLGDSALYVVLPVFYMQLGLSLWEVGVLLSVNRFIRIPIHPLVMRFYRHGDHVIQGFIIGLLLTFVSTLSYGMFTSFSILLIARVLWGIAWSFIRQGGQLTIVQVAASTKRSGELVGKYNGVSRIGSVVGMVIGGFGASVIGVDLVFIVFSSLTVLMMPVVYFIWKRDTALTENSNRSKDVDNRTVKTPAFIIKVAFVLIPGLLIAIIYQGFLKSTLGYWIAERDISSMIIFSSLGAGALTGLLQGFRYGIEPLIAPWIGKQTDVMQSKYVIMAFILFVAALLFLLVPVSISIEFWLIVIVLLSLLSIISITLMDTIAVERTIAVSNPAQKQKIITAYLIASDIGAAIGPAGGFFLIGLFGDFRTILVVSSILFSTAILFSYQHFYKRIC